MIVTEAFESFWSLIISNRLPVEEDKKEPKTVNPTRDEVLAFFDNHLLTH